MITKDSETPDDIAKSATVIEDLPGVVCGYHLAILRPKKGIDGMFLGRLLMLPKVRYEFTRLANGATRYGLTLSSISEIPLWMPPQKEQESIAKLFLELDRELRNLRAAIVQLKVQKQGLMRELLTAGFA